MPDLKPPPKEKIEQQRIARTSKRIALLELRIGSVEQLVQALVDHTKLAGE